MTIGGQSSRAHISVKLSSEPNYHVSPTILFSSITDLLIMDVDINGVRIKWHSFFNNFKAGREFSYFSHVKT